MQNMKSWHLTVQKLWSRLQLLNLGEETLSRSQRKPLWYGGKHLVTSSARMEYESPTSMVQRLWQMLMFLEIKVTVKVTGSLTLMSFERDSLVEYLLTIESLTFTVHISI